MQFPFSRLADCSAEAGEGLGVFVKPRFSRVHGLRRQQNLAGVVHMDYETQIAGVIYAVFLELRSVESREGFGKRDALSPIESGIADTLKFIVQNYSIFAWHGET